VTATRTQRVDALLVFASMAMLSVTAWVLVRSIAEGTGDETPTHVAEAPPVIDTSPFVAMRQPTPPTPAAPTGPSAPRPGVEPESTVQRLRAHTGATSFAEPQEASVMNDFLWGVYPYLCIILFFFVPVIRMITRPFSWSTRASSMFGHRLLGVASLLLHWGLFLVLAGHLAGLFGGVLGSQGAITFFYWSGLVGGFMVLAGSLTALYRRVTSPPVRAMSQPDDYVVLLFIIAIVGLALYQVIVHRIFGVAYTASSWAASLWTLNPQPGLIMSVSLITKLHLLLALTFFAYFPFTKLVHFWTFPINYFVLRLAERQVLAHLRAGPGGRDLRLRGDPAGAAAAVRGLGDHAGAGPGDRRRLTPDRISPVRQPVRAMPRDHRARGRARGRLPDLRGAATRPGGRPASLRLDPKRRRLRRRPVSHDLSWSHQLTNTGMPGFASLTDDQILSLIDVLNDFRAGGSEPGPPIHVGTPPPATERSLARGRELYLEVCVSCHGDQGRGDGTVESYDYLQHVVVPADLAAGDIKAGDSAEQVYLRIAAGIPGGYAGTDVMLNFSQLPQEDLWALVHYLKTQIMPESSESR